MIRAISVIMCTRSLILVLITILCVLTDMVVFCSKDHHANDKTSTIPQQSGKWRHFDKRLTSESGIGKNYVSASKDSAMVSYDGQDFRKNQLLDLHDQIKQQLPKESKFFDEFEGSKKLTSSSTLINCCWLNNSHL